jgi:N-acylneuraminate cytidylyltransferase
MNIAFIPVRGGSKSIPLKNIREIAGKPLVYWTAKAANDCRYIDKVYVATDSSEIREKVESFKLDKVEVVGRSEQSASDTASTESAMIEFATNYEFETIALIQATSPLLTSEDLNGGFELFNSGDTDSVLSVVRQKRFVWQKNSDGNAEPLNYDVLKRPRRQEFEGFLVENGAFYITSRDSFINSKCRISGNIKAYEMDGSTYFEIDEPSDWLIIEQQLKDRNKENRIQIPNIKMFLTDCDGCLTDGGMYYSEKGDELKKFNTRDGMGFRLLKEKGILSGIVTGENVELNRRRVDKLKIDFYIPGCTDKYQKICELCEANNISLNEVAYVGDDINDIEAVRNVGFGCCVADGMESVKKSAKYISKLNGGNGAVREVIDLILNNQNGWD